MSGRTSLSDNQKAALFRCGADPEEGARFGLGAPVTAMTANSLERLGFVTLRTVSFGLGRKPQRWAKLTEAGVAKLKELGLWTGAE